MAEAPGARRKPRIRKSAPTIREKVEEAAKAKEMPAKRGRVRRVVAAPAKPMKRFRLGERKPVQAAKVPFRYIRKGLAWIIPSYFVNSWREMRLVYWPNRRETWRLTLAVFIFAIVFGALVAGVDKGLDEVFKKVILK